ncbi:MAG: nucleotidyl transferase AbiEii/AbiGii toxin family protein [Alphaproteobacteria bacterium]|nr:nucleotidyl transferase AbiEii/AbiGii toxin family protein [Alphaproteobacteria bacterium]
MRDKGFLNHLTFIGGTCIRLCHHGARLSEDLDFTGGFDFKPENLMDLCSNIERTLKKKYQLKVVVTLKDKNESDVATWHVCVETNPQDKSKKQQKIHVDICSFKSYDPKPTIIANRYGIDGDTIIVQAQTLEEIYVDKLIAFVLRNKVKYRDIWDIVWIYGRSNVELNKKWMMAKISDRKTKIETFLNEFIKRFHHVIDQSKAISAEGYKNEMTRFLTKDQLSQCEYEWDVAKNIFRNAILDIIEYCLEKKLLEEMNVMELLTFLSRDQLKQLKNQIHNLLNNPDFIPLEELTIQHDDIYKKIDLLYESSKDFGKKSRDLYRKDWEKSREIKKLKEEIVPIFKVAKGYEGQSHYTNLTSNNLIISKFPIHELHCIQITHLDNRTEIQPITHIKFTGENKEYDGVYRFLDGKEQKFEVTVVNTGHENAQARSEAREHGVSNIYNAYCSLKDVLERVNKKVKKNKYRDCWLIVFLDRKTINEFLDDIKDAIDFNQSEILREFDWQHFKSILFVADDEPIYTFTPVE